MCSAMVEQQRSPWLAACPCVQPQQVTYRHGLCPEDVRWVQGSPFTEGRASQHVDLLVQLLTSAVLFNHGKEELVFVS